MWNNTLKRSMPAIVALALTLGFTTAGDAASKPKNSPPTDISGVWWTKSYTPSLTPMDGSKIPYTEEGQKRRDAWLENAKKQQFVSEARLLGVDHFEDYVKRMHSGDFTGVKISDLKLQERPPEVTDVALQRCTPLGLTRTLAAPYPFLILQSHTQVNFLFEVNKAARFVRLEQGHINPGFWDPSFMGDGVGRWEGDTLVIDTVNFNDGIAILDRAGIPQTDTLHVVERIRKIKGGSQLENIITIEDPVMFTKPWKVRLVYEYRPDVRIRTPWVCDEPHRDVSHITGGK